MTRARHRWTLAVIAVAGFMTMLDNTVVNAALPSIQWDLGLPPSALVWVAISYILAFAGLMLAGGRLAEAYGRKRVFLLGVAVFTAASGLAGMTRTAETLIAARAVQGAGAALVLPAGLALVNAGRTARERATGAGAWIGAGVMTLALGPAAGGYISQHWHWNWIFLVNVAPGALVVLLGLVAIPESRDRAAGRVDLPGVLASGTALFAVVYALAQVPAHGWASRVVLGASALAVVSVAVLVAVEQWAPAPMVDLALFRGRAFAGGVAVQVLWGAGFTGVLFHISIVPQRALGFSAARTGAVFVPAAVIVAALTPVSFWVGRKFGARATVGWGLVLTAAGVAALALLGPGDGYRDLLPGIALVGVGSALTIPLATYVMAAIPPERGGAACGVLGMARVVSGAFGVVVAGVAGAGPGGGTVLRHSASYGLLAGAGLVCAGALIAVATLPRRERRARPAGRHRPSWAPPEERVVVLTWSSPGGGAR
jgi:EmrB/QacA subfamily drug resistance transporter